ncbi:MAG TPA: multiubiquitin domain-containing protein [Longimicrobiales bacterium]
MNTAAGPNPEFRIVVNGREKVVTQRELSFMEVVRLAFDPPPTGPYIVFTVTYRRGTGNKPEGTLVEGESVKLKDGMIFNVTATDKS